MTAGSPQGPGATPQRAGAGAEPPANLPQAIRLLLACVRTTLEPERRAEVVTLLRDGVDWTDMVRLALLHGLTPALGAGLRGMDPELVPEEIREALERHLTANTERNTELARELLALVDALAGRGVQAIPFKGPALAELAFGDLALRRAGDLDLLVRPEAIGETCRVLSDAGYCESTEYTTGRPLSASENAALLRYQCEYLFVRPRDGVAVEPHWALAPRNLALPLDHADLWTRARRRPFQGGSVLSLALEDLLLALCVHAAKHEWEELRWIADVAVLLRRHPELDVEVALERARSQRCGRILRVGLELARALLGAPLPEPLARSLRTDATVQDLTRAVIVRLAGGGPRPPSVFEVSRFRLRLLDRRRDRVRSVARTLVTPRIEHFRTIRLPAPLFFLYVPLKLGHDYVVLPLWWAGKWAVRETGRALGSRRAVQGG